MRVTMICCPFKTSFGSYTNSLKTAIESKTGSSVRWVGSNCGCGDPQEVNRQFQISMPQGDYFDLPMYGEYRSTKAWRRSARSAARSVLTAARGRRYASMSRGADVVHFQQVLNAYGSKAVFSWLKQPSDASRIITVHELDADQLESPKRNAIYNRADGIIVHCEEMRQHLLRLGVEREKIHVVLYGTSLPAPLVDSSREGILFYCGHKVMTGKGIDTLFKAMQIVKAKMAERTPMLKILGHYGTTTPPEALQLAVDHGVDDKIVWVNQLPEEETVRLFQRSLFCVLPYTGSFAGYAASLAAACRLPVVCTRKAGLPDYLGEDGVWIEENSPALLAERMIEMIENQPRRSKLGEQLFKRAQAFLSWDVIAEQTLKIYEDAQQKKAGRQVNTTASIARAS